MTLKKLDYVFLSVGDMIEYSRSFLENIIQRRTVRDFSDKPVPIEIIENAIKSASSAPSGANKQPWHFVIVKDPVLKKEIRIAAEKEEKEFYEHRASVGIASGFLLTALHNAGLASLTHTPSPMGFLEKILKRPKNEKAVLLIPVGYPAENAKVPDLKKKSFQEVVTII